MSGNVTIYDSNMDIIGENSSDYFGSAVAISNDASIIAIGGRQNDGNGSNSGHVRVYRKEGIKWNQLGNDIDGEAFGDYSGWAIALSADGLTIGITARYNDGLSGILNDSGHARIYSYNGSNWVQKGSDIDGSDTNEYLGDSISLSPDGNVVVIGATNFNNGSSNPTMGIIRMYRYNEGALSWDTLGISNEITGGATGDLLGHSVSITNYTIDPDPTPIYRLAVGAIQTGTGNGYVSLYEYDIGGIWNLIDGSPQIGESSGDESGYSVSLSADGTIVAIGAVKNSDNGTNAGHTRIYNTTTNPWTQLGSDIDGETLGDYSGYSVSLSSDGTTVAIGAVYNTGQGSQAGHTRIYQYIGGNWVQKGLDIDGTTNSKYSGYSVGLARDDGNTVIIGSPNPTNKAKVFDYNSTLSRWEQTGLFYQTPININYYKSNIVVDQILYGNLTNLFGYTSEGYYIKARDYSANTVVNTVSQLNNGNIYSRNDIFDLNQLWNPQYLYNVTNQFGIISDESQVIPDIANSSIYIYLGPRTALEGDTTPFPLDIPNTLSAINNSPNEYFIYNGTTDLLYPEPLKSNLSSTSLSYSYNLLDLNSVSSLSLSGTIVDQYGAISDINNFANAINLGLFDFAFVFDSNMSTLTNAQLEFSNISSFSNIALTIPIDTINNSTVYPVQARDIIDTTNFKTYVRVNSTASLDNVSVLMRYALFDSFSVTTTPRLVSNNVTTQLSLVPVDDIYINRFIQTPIISNKKTAYVESIPYLRDMSATLLDKMRLWKNYRIETPSLNITSTQLHNRFVEVNGTIQMM